VAAVHINVKVKFTLSMACRYGGSRGMDPFILNVGARKRGVAKLTPCHLTTRIETWYPLNRKLSGPQIGRSGRFGEDKEHFLPSIFALRTVQPVA
jgi:hypothetical protein